METHPSSLPLHSPNRGSWYFITGATLDRAFFFHNPRLMEMWRASLFELLPEFDIVAGAWVVLKNHYHLLLQSAEGKNISRLVGRLHGKTARELDALEDQPNRKIWYRYWEVCLKNEREFWMRWNAIHYNPVKHGYVRRPEEWFFSSYRAYYESGEVEWLKKMWKEFPVARIEVDFF